MSTESSGTVEERIQVQIRMQEQAVAAARTRVREIAADVLRWAKEFDDQVRDAAEPEHAWACGLTQRADSVKDAHNKLHDAVAPARLEGADHGLARTPRTKNGEPR